MLVIDSVPSLIVSLEEAHLSKPEAKLVVNFLKTMGMQVCMITGDNKHAAYKVSNHLGIAKENVSYQAYPETKKKIVEKY